MSSLPRPEPQRFSLGILLLLSLGFLILAYLVANLMSWILLISGDVYTVFLWISILIAVLLPFLRYPQRYLALGAPCIVLLVWFVAAGFVLPPLVKTYDISKAKSMLPKYTAIQPVRVAFNPGDGFDNGPLVAFQYRSDNPQADYDKLHDYYKEQLVKKGWQVMDEYGGDDSKYIRFRKYLSSSNISVNCDNKGEYPLNIVVTF